MYILYSFIFHYLIEFNKANAKLNMLNSALTHSQQKIKGPVHLSAMEQNYLNTQR